jgi:hypothetical protein
MAACLAGCAIEYHHHGDESPPGPDASIQVFDAAPMRDAPPPPPPPDPVEVPIVTPTITCSETVTADETAFTFNARLTTAGRTICIANGVTISGLVQVGADNITIASPAVGEVGKVLDTSGDAISINGHLDIQLVRLDIQSKGGSLSSAIRVDASSVLVTETTASCEGNNCYALHVEAGSARVARSTLSAGLATQTSSTMAAYGWNGAYVEIADSTIRAHGAAIWDTVFSHFIVRRCTLESAGSYQAIEVYNSNATLLLQSSTIRTENLAVTAGGATKGVTVKLDGNTFRHVAGTPAGAKSPIESGLAVDVFHSTQANTFCNEGTSTADGAFGSPLVTGAYSSTSTFGSVANVGPIDCPN